jgi:hypothetical protein
VIYRPPRTIWVVIALLVDVVASTLCEAGAGDLISFPRVLWLLPNILLIPIGLALMTVLIDRVRVWRRRESKSE